MPVAAPVHPSPCTEIVLYRVRTSAEAEEARRAAMPVIAALPGFVSWQALTCFDDTSLFADIVVWETHDAAKAAADAFGRESRLCVFADAISQVIVMSHARVTHRQDRPTATEVAHRPHAYNGFGGPRTPRSHDCPTATNDATTPSPFAA